jgi:hypothetical protein
MYLDFSIYTRVCQGQVGQVVVLGNYKQLVVIVKSFVLLGSILKKAKCDFTRAVPVLRELSRQCLSAYNGLWSTSRNLLQTP